MGQSTISVETFPYRGRRPVSEGGSPENHFVLWFLYVPARCRTTIILTNDHKRFTLRSNSIVMLIESWGGITTTLTLPYIRRNHFCSALIGWVRTVQLLYSNNRGRSSTALRTTTQKPGNVIFAVFTGSWGVISAITRSARLRMPALFRSRGRIMTLSFRI